MPLVPPVTRVTAPRPPSRAGAGRLQVQGDVDDHVLLTADEPTLADLQQELGVYNDMATTTSLLADVDAGSTGSGMATAAIAGWQAMPWSASKRAC